MKKRLLITRRLPYAAEARANRDYAVTQNADDHQMTDDEIVDMVRTGHLSMSDAMNRDF